MTVTVAIQMFPRHLNDSSSNPDASQKRRQSPGFPGSPVSGSQDCCCCCCCFGNFSISKMGRARIINEVAPVHNAAVEKDVSFGPQSGSDQKWLWRYRRQVQSPSTVSSSCPLSSSRSFSPFHPAEDTGVASVGAVAMMVWGSKPF